jgi:hypothetical protein
MDTCGTTRIRDITNCSMFCSSAHLPQPHSDIRTSNRCAKGCCGAILCEWNLDNHAQVVAYASRRLSKVECNYNISDREGLAVIFGIKHFRQYLHVSRFNL